MSSSSQLHLRILVRKDSLERIEDQLRIFSTDFTPESASRTAQAAFQKGPGSYKRLLTVKY